MISYQSLLIHPRRLSILRESFRADNLKFLEFDIPVMALTATATIHVQEDILKSLCMSKETKVVLTSFFRPNLRFSVSVSFLTGCTFIHLIFRFCFCHLHVTAGLNLYIIIL